eukprot:TRINITY_DN377_c0_g1_i1.p2 TRINITY_DN377_c0_g1~~TRINITY_DN377_c0_g1_i1.p2  ORF type:complete len:229 (-),score=24.64 TRINITY_DN377_c0_g1_i1:70-756(-)
MALLSFFALMVVCGCGVCVVDAGHNVTATTTFYGAKDNCPPGGDIAYPQIHKLAGGVGTHANPITYAGSRDATKPGTRIYVFFLQKYFIMEDDCEECDSDWKDKRRYHFDLWMGPDSVTKGPNLIACEDALTRGNSLVEIDPPASYPVNQTPLFDGSSLKCIVYAPPCHDQGNECGNSCEIPESATCNALERMFDLSATRFRQLNPHLNCNGKVPEGTSVCMGGTCGD